METEGSGAWGKAAAVVLCRYVYNRFCCCCSTADSDRHNSSLIFVDWSVDETNGVGLIIMCQFMLVCHWNWIQLRPLEQLISTAPLCTLKSTTSFDENQLDLLFLWSGKFGCNEVFCKKVGLPPRSLFIFTNILIKTQLSNITMVFSLVKFITLSEYSLVA